MEDGLVLRRLLDAGYSPITLANALGLNPEDVVGVAAEPQVEIVGDDEMLVNAARALVWRVVNETFRILDEGSLQTRMALISKLSGPLFKMVSASSGSDLDDMRVQMAELTKAIREQVEGDGQPTDHPVEVPEDREPEPELGPASVPRRSRSTAGRRQAR